jgi:hypothetical protein
VAVELRIPNGYANVQWIFSLNGSSHQFSFAHGVKYAVDTEPQDLGAMAVACVEDGYDMGNVYNDWTFDRAHIIQNIGGDKFSLDQFAEDPGTGGAGEFPPPNSSLIVKKITGRAGRQYRGRMYWPLLSIVDADVDDTGIVDPTVLGVIAGNIENFKEQLELSPFVDSIVLLHTSNETPTDVVSWGVEALLGTQRRRLR